MEYTDTEMKKLIYSIIIVFMDKNIVTPVDCKVQLSHVTERASVISDEWREFDFCHRNPNKEEKRSSTGSGRKNKKLHRLYVPLRNTPTFTMN